MQAFDIKVGSRVKIEDVYLDGVHSREIFKIESIEGNDIKAVSENTGSPRKWLFHTGSIAERCLIKSLEISKQKTTGFIFTLLD